VSVMARRGVADPRCAVLSEVTDGPFDTLLLLMHGAGLGGDLKGLLDLLRDSLRLLSSDGAVLIDSADPSGSVEGANDEVGVASMRLAFRGTSGSEFPWIYLSARALAGVAGSAGLDCALLWQGGGGRYVARLTRATRT
jgi:hypothetical protein